MQGEIGRNQWKDFLDEFSVRNQLRPARLEVVGIDIGAQEEGSHLPLIGISFEPRGAAAGSVEIILGGESTEDPRHLTHSVLNVDKISPLVGLNSVEGGLGIEDKEGAKTLLIFDVLGELPETTADSSENA